MAKNDMRRWAVLGAEQRLAQLAEEASAIYAAFPELRARKGGIAGGAPPLRGRRAAASTGSSAPRRRRRRLSAEARKRISDAQKARWAKQKKAAAK